MAKRTEPQIPLPLRELIIIGTFNHWYENKLVCKLVGQIPRLDRNVFVEETVIGKTEEVFGKVSDAFVLVDLSGSASYKPKKELENCTFKMRKYDIFPNDYVFT